MREALDPQNPNALGLPDDEIAGRELTGIRYRYTSSGQIQVEGKDDMRRRGLASPDRADAVVFTLDPGVSRSFETWIAYTRAQLAQQKIRAEEQKRSEVPVLAGDPSVSVEELRMRAFTRKRY